MVKKFTGGIINMVNLAELSIANLIGSSGKGLPHSCLHKAPVNVGMALPAGIHADISHSIAKVQSPYDYYHKKE